jgi:hypothetical protein
MTWNRDDSWELSILIISFTARDFLSRLSSDISFSSPQLDSINATAYADANQPAFRVQWFIAPLHSGVSEQVTCMGDCPFVVTVTVPFLSVMYSARND